MSLNKTPVYRNLRTRVTFICLEYEDLIVVLLVAPVAFFVGSFFDREILGIPMKLVLQWGVTGPDGGLSTHIQIRQAARLPSRLVHLSHKTACLLWD